mgnify:CR=1 FL=1
MLSDVTFMNVEIFAKGSVYPNRAGNQTLGFAFYYQVRGKKKERKVIKGNSEEELRNKAIAFLSKLDKEYENEKNTVNVVNVTTSPESINVIYKKEPEHVNLTFKEVGDIWYEDYKKRLNKLRDGISYSSLEGRDLAYRRICSYIGDLCITDVTQDVADNLIEKSMIKPDGTKYSFSYMDKLQQTFHMIMRYADEKKWYDYQLKTTPLNILEKADTDARFLDREQIAEVLEILKDNDRYKIIVELIVASGLRQEEVFALHMSDFKPVNNKDVEIHINKSVRKMGEYQYEIVDFGKTDTSRRVVTISFSTYEKVLNYYNSLMKKETFKNKELRIKNKTNDLIFANKEMKVINKKTFERNFANYIKRQLNNLDKTLDYEVTLHMFRHSYASLMAETTPVEVVARLLGDSISTTEKNYYSMSKNVKKNVSTSSEDIMKSIEDINKSKNEE